MSESTQHKLDRVRPPRVQITYDVEIGGAIQMKELPFVVGILADLAGQQDALPRLKDRKFVQIDRDNFNQVLGNIAPKLKYSVLLVKKTKKTLIAVKKRHIQSKNSLLVSFVAISLLAHIILLAGSQIKK